MHLSVIQRRIAEAMKKPGRLPRIAVLIREEDAEFYNQARLGIAVYHDLHGPWEILNEYLMIQLSELGPGCGLDGIITVPTRRHEMTREEMVPKILSCGVPVVSIAADPVDQPFPVVWSDDVAVARLAANHLLERGFTHLAYQGMPVGSSERRQRAFVELIRNRGYLCHVYESVQPWWDMRVQEKASAEWLKNLPKPVGLFVFNDDLALLTTQVCRRNGIAVPEDVAVIGVDNTVSCVMIRPTLSSIPLNGRRTGFEAAKLLDRLMKGKPPPEGPILIPPLPLVVRRSSDVFVNDDADVAAAQRFIADNANRPLTVAHVIGELAISRRSLERRFKISLGRTPQDEIWRAHVERAKRLLIETDLSMVEIASHAGFRTQFALCNVFRRRVGMPPTSFRARHRNSDRSARERP